MRVNNGLTTIIEIKDKQGRVINKREVATYRGLLAKAHDEGLREIRTTLVQIPTNDHEVAIVTAQVVTQRGIFTGIGDASPANVRAGIDRHLIRMAETRAKARALRDAVNIGVVALEELGELLEDDLAYEGNTERAPGSDGDERRPSVKMEPARVSPSAPTSASQSVASSARASRPPSSSTPEPVAPLSHFAPMTEPQRRLLFRLASQQGVKPEEIHDWLKKQCRVESLKAVTKQDASRLIDQLQDRGNGAPAGAGQVAS